MLHHSWRRQIINLQEECHSKSIGTWGSYSREPGVARFVRHRISRTEPAVKSISFTQQIGMKAGINILEYFLQYFLKFCGLAADTSTVQPCSDRKLKVCSLIIHQVSTSFLLGNLGSSFVSVGMLYCVMKAFVTFVRACSRLIESCVGLPTSLYTGTLN